MSATKGLPHSSLNDRLGEAAQRMGTANDSALPPIVPSFLTAGELMAEFPEVAPYIIEGLLRRGEVMNFIAAPKVGKSWLVLHLILCIASGRMFLGRFRVKCGRVLLIDNELHATTLSKRIKAVAEAMGLTQDEYADNLFVESLRGKGARLDRLMGYADAVGPDKFVLVVINAWYRAIPKGFDENSDMTAAFNMVDVMARTMGTAIVLIHHASKGNQSDKAIWRGAEVVPHEEQ